METIGEAISKSRFVRDICRGCGENIRVDSLKPDGNYCAVCSRDGTKDRLTNKPHAAGRFSILDED